MAIDETDEMNRLPVDVAAQVMTTTAEVGPRAWAAQRPPGRAAPTALESPAAVLLLQETVSPPPGPPLDVFKVHREQHPPPPMAFLDNPDRLPSRLEGIAAPVHGGSRGRAGSPPTAGRVTFATTASRGVGIAEVSVWKVVGGASG